MRKDFFVQRRKELEVVVAVMIGVKGRQLKGLTEILCTGWPIILAAFLM